MDGGTDHDLADVSAVDKDYAWAVGASGTILFFDGTSWREDPQSRVITQELLWSVMALGRNNVWAVGANDLLLFFDGVSWTVQNGEATEERRLLTNSVCVDPLSVDGVVGMTMFGGRSPWECREEDPVEVDVLLRDLPLNAVNERSVLYSTVYRENEGDNAARNAFRDISVRNAARVCAVGEGGLTALFNGFRWIPQQPTTQENLRGVSFFDDAGIWVVGDGGTILLGSQHARRIELQGQKNFRDLGGYKNVHGKPVEWGALFRSGQLHDLTDADFSVVSNLGLKLIIDFRSEGERDDKPDRIPEGASVLADPISCDAYGELVMYVLETGDTSQLTPDQTLDLFDTIYLDNLEPFQLLLSQVIESENRPVLFHCSGGKDRTGFAAALILAALQVPLNVIVDDYLLSNKYLESSSQEMLDEFSREIEENTGTAPTEEDLERMNSCLIEVRPEHLLRAFQTVFDAYGTIENYIVQGLGIPQTDIEEFRNQVLAKDAFARNKRVLAPHKDLADLELLGKLR
jgi:protein-tyrosine phosphatase